MQALTVPLSRYLREFPTPEALHAFERALLELSVGEERYVAALHRVAELRKPLSEVRPAPDPAAMTSGFSQKIYRPGVYDPMRVECLGRIVESHRFSSRVTGS